MIKKLKFLFGNTFSYVPLDIQRFMCVSTVYNQTSDILYNIGPSLPT